MTKVTKSVAGSALHPPPTFSPASERSFRGSAPRGADSAGKRLTKEERHIETPDTAGDGGGNIACTVGFLATCGRLWRECEE